MSLRELIQACEHEIRAGHPQLAAQRLARQRVSAATPEQRHQIANLCRRSGLVTLGLKWLTPRAAVDRLAWQREALPAEVAEYALLLQRVGSITEAERLLIRINEVEFPEALLYRAFCHFNRWEYAESLPLLNAYVGLQNDAYRRLVGQVNLAAALVSTVQVEPARALLDEIAHACERDGLRRLLANTYELRAQVALIEGDLEQLRSWLASSAPILGHARTLDQLFVQKLEALVTARATGSILPLERFRLEATQRRDWESVREADLLMSQQAFSLPRFEHLMFGTPFPAYRARVESVLGVSLLNKTFILGQADGRILDLANAQIGTSEGLRAGGKSHQLLEILARDLYRPKSIGALFSELFPEAHYDVYTSSDRVHQVLRRTRQQLRTLDLGLTIQEWNHSYRLHVGTGAGLKLQFERRHVDWNCLILDRWRARSNPSAMTGAELRASLHLTEAPFRRFITWALHEGHAQRSGAGKATRYDLITAHAPTHVPLKVA